MGELPDKPTTYDLVHVIEEHLHGSQMCYPTLADPVEVTAGGGAWTLGNFTEIVPAAAIGSPFDIHFAVLSNPDSNEDYELHLFYGAGDVECARIAFTRTGAFTGSLYQAVITPIMPADSRIWAKLADGSGGAKVDVKLIYHTY